VVLSNGVVSCGQDGQYGGKGDRVIKNRRVAAPLQQQSTTTKTNKNSNEAPTAT
jgi:hypothetical protein